MTAHQLDLLRRIYQGYHPLAGVRGRRVGAVCRNLKILGERGLVFRRRFSRYKLTLRARRLVEASP